MRYVALLQRFDDAHVQVAEGLELEPVVAAATAVYAALVPTILERGRRAIRERANEERNDGGPERFWQDTEEMFPLHGLSSCLRAEEWNVTVYDQDESTIESDVVFTIGALLEDPSLR